MITRIELVNYMSHKRTVIEPAEGLTVLVGPNNCGKSAIADALRTLCGQNNGKYMVRHNEKLSKVTLETSEGHTISWCRKKNTVFWEVDGREIHRGIPEDLHEKLRLPLVSPEGSPQAFSIHFSDQKQPLFLLDMPPSAPALFFAAASDARHLIRLRQAHKQNEQRLKDDAKRLAADFEKNEQTLAILAPVPTLSESLSKLEDDYQRLKTANDTAARLEEDCQRIGSMQAEVTVLDNRFGVLEPLTSPPILFDADSLEGLLGDTESEMENLRRHEGIDEALIELQAPPTLAPTAELVRLVVETQSLLGDMDYLRRRHTAFEILRSPPTLRDDASLEALTDELTAVQLDCAHFTSAEHVFEKLYAPSELRDPMPLEALTQQLEEAERQLNKSKTRCLLNESLRELPLFADTNPLSALVDALDAAHVEKHQFELELQQLDAQKEDLKHEMHVWVEQVGACPTCGQPIDDDIFKSGRSHGH